MEEISISLKKLETSDERDNILTRSLSDCHDITSSQKYDTKLSKAIMCKRSTSDSICMQKIMYIKKSEDITKKLEQLRNNAKRKRSRLSVYGERTLTIEEESVSNIKTYSNSKGKKFLSDYINKQWENIENLSKKLLMLSHNDNRISENVLGSISYNDANNNYRATKRLFDSKPLCQRQVAVVRPMLIKQNQIDILSESTTNSQIKSGENHKGIDIPDVTNTETGNLCESLNNVGAVEIADKIGVSKEAKLPNVISERSKKNDLLHSSKRLSQPQETFQQSTVVVNLFDGIAKEKKTDTSDHKFKLDINPKRNSINFETRCYLFDCQF